MKYQVLHPYQIRGEMIFLYISVFIFLYSKLEDKKILHQMIAGIG